MPKRRRRHSYRGGAASGGSAKRIALGALRRVKDLKRGIEHKKIDTVVQYSTQTTPVVNVLSLCASGDDTIQRTGNKIKGTSLFYRYGVGRAPASSTERDLVRVIVFIDKESKGIVPGWGEVLENSDIYSPLNLDNGKRFKVMQDKIHAVTDTRPYAQVKRYNKLGRVIQFDDVNATMADAVANHVFVMIMTDAASNPPRFHGQFRLKFTDL